eukprot:Plantae.Rhodophyta-Hildenbrandia_rubra.ctg5807.p1 GENE.Plantae.Rhodophyta-Hildenbrandia_rubra.ctg5807~~Plantae.Rhodophyta-Hildenbrandia_rubra.ctg5807.p1  ORF type:complete len:1064 (+),score=180.75 Plantae.Rhodophyta-Hildenbrandia_rubra.ctg5807:4115-7306(+)
MGVPSFFRWLSLKYPRIVSECIEHVTYHPGTKREVRTDPSGPNPNGVEYDNLYLDMNGIIHPCTHPEDRPPPKTEQEMFEAVFDYIDRIVAIVRPRKLLYLAIDGVAPRARINQQRSRRFVSAQEAEMKKNAMSKVKEEWQLAGLQLPEDADEDDEVDDADATAFDSNVITPGTPFMSRIAVALKEYVARRMETDKLWANLKIIFSDASVPGEGEHKIAEFIRVQRAQNSYNPALQHVLYGLDADLIMLGLMTHEVHFTILREEVLFGRGGRRPDNNSNTTLPNSSVAKEVTTVDAASQIDGVHLRSKVGGKKPFVFLHISILREYLENEFKADIEAEHKALVPPRGNPVEGFQYDLERVIDDFVFLCFFVGNDFLPRLPTFDIREGAVDYLIELYKTHVPQTGYITHSAGEVNFERMRNILKHAAPKETQVFQERIQREKAAEERNKRNSNPRKRSFESVEKFKSTTTAPPAPKVEELIELGSSAKKQRQEGLDPKAVATTALQKSLARIAATKAVCDEKSDEPAVQKHATLGKDEGTENQQPSDVEAKNAKMEVLPQASGKETTIPDAKAPASDAPKERNYEKDLKELLKKDEQNIVLPDDNVRLGDPGWKARYYQAKFHWAADDTKSKAKLVTSYMEGLAWVMKYYYRGCVSWTWYYPYHYAPFASDIVEANIQSSDIKFDIGVPFHPFTQLMGVMPPSSGVLVLPKCYSSLMTDPVSPILDYYPKKFKIDLNGKRFVYQGVVLLPFVDEKRLLDAISGLSSELDESERKRNSFGHSYIIAHRNSPLGKFVGSVANEGTASIVEEVAAGLTFGTVKREGCMTTGVALSATLTLPEMREHKSELLPTAPKAESSLDNFHKAEAERFGWRNAIFGPLGKEAKRLRMNRRQRLFGGGRRYHAKRFSAPPHPGYHAVNQQVQPGSSTPSGRGHQNYPYGVYQPQQYQPQRQSYVAAQPSRASNQGTYGQGTYVQSAYAPYTPVYNAGQTQYQNGTYQAPAYGSVPYAPTETNQSHYQNQQANPDLHYGMNYQSYSSTGSYGSGGRGLSGPAAANLRGRRFPRYK